MQSIILAGGLGTRLRGVIGDVPKCMAPVAGKPFLHYLFRYLTAQKISRVVLSLGYKSDAVIDWIAACDWPFRTDWVIETEPLGTGGGIRLAMEQCDAEDVFVLNGDTMFKVDLRKMHGLHSREEAETTIALKAMHHVDRYGTVGTHMDGNTGTSTILSFREKAPQETGDINGGIYLVNRQAFIQRPFPQKFSFEKDYLERFVGHGKFRGYHSDGYFIDIGVPQDYAQAQLDFQTQFPA